MKNQPSLTYLARHLLLAFVIVLSLAFAPDAAPWQPVEPVQAAPLVSGVDLPVLALFPSTLLVYTQVSAGR